MKKLKLWVLRLILSQDEMYLIERAIEDRIDNLRRISVSERWVIKDEMDEDIDDYIKLYDYFIIPKKLQK